MRRISTTRGICALISNPISIGDHVYGPNLQDCAHPLKSIRHLGQRNAEIITRVSMHFGEFARFKVLLPNSAAGSCDTLTAASNDATIADGVDKDV